MKRVVVLGGGISGRTVAEHLVRSRVPCQITLIDRNNNNILNLQVLAGETWFSSTNYRKFLEAKEAQTWQGKPKYEFFQEEVVDVNLGAKTVKTSRRTLKADILVLSLGSGSWSEGEVSHALFYPWVMDDCMSVPEIIDRLTGRDMAGRSRYEIGVVGGGIQGVSLALFIQNLLNKKAKAKSSEKSQNWRVVVFERTGSLCHLNSEGTRFVSSLLAKRGIEIRLHRSFKNMDSQDMVFDNGFREKGTAFAFWVAGQSTPVDDSFSQRLVVNRNFLVRGLEDVFCLGDQAAVPIPHRLPSRQALLDEANYVANAVVCKLRNKAFPNYASRDSKVDIPISRFKVLRIFKGQAGIKLRWIF